MATSLELGVGASQVIDQLSAAAWAFMALLQFFLNHVLCLRVASDALTARRLGGRSAILARLARHHLVVVVALGWVHAGLLLIHLLELFLVRERIRAELLGLLLGTLLIGTHLSMVGNAELITAIDPLHRVATALLGTGHVEDGRGLARVIDNNVVDIVIVYDVRNVATLGLRNTLLLVGRRTTTAHSEPLAIRVPRTLEASLILTLLSHGVLSQFLRSTEWLSLISIIADEIVIFLLV